MYKLELKDFILSHENWEELLTAEPYYLKVSRDNGYIMFKYNQLCSDFNIPLVREARGIIFRESDWKCVSFPFHKFGNYSESYCPEINWETASVQEKVDGCFSGEDCVMMADGSKKKIKEIVNNKLNCEVLSYNFVTNKVEPKKVIGWNKSRSTRNVNEWLTIYLSGVKSTLHNKLSQHNVITPTKNHIFFIKKDNKIEEVEARDLKENDIVLTPVISLTDVERQVAIGTLLGDGSLTYLDTDGYCGIRFTHSSKQEEYVNFKASLLDKVGGKVTKIIVENSYGKEKTRYIGHTHPEYTEIYKIIYDSNTRKKKITYDFLQKINWLGFAIWYMDDGSLQTGCKNNSIHLHTEGFPKEDVELINKFYNEKGYKNYIQHYKTYSIINFSTEASEIIWKNIRAYIPKCMQYKLPDRHRGYYQEIIDDNCREILLVEKKIKKIEQGLKVHNLYHSKSCYSYDIEVEDNHNYFCQGVLVHNSLIKFWYDDGWHISTNGTIDAFKANLNDAKYQNFGQLVIDAIHKVFTDEHELFNMLDTKYTYMFELVSPYNRVVIPYEKTELYFLGSRMNRNGVEYMPELSKVSNYFKIPKRYNLSSLEDVRKAANALQWDQEGYVVCDADFNRVKIKSPSYVMAHYARNNNTINIERLVQIVLNGEQKEFLIYASDYADELNDVEEIMNKIADSSVECMKKLFGASYEFKSRGDYAREVVKHPIYMKDFLFHCFDNRIFWDYAKSWSVDRWVKAVNEFKEGENK